MTSVEIETSDAICHSVNSHQSPRVETTLVQMSRMVGRGDFAPHEIMSIATTGEGSSHTE